MVDNQYGNLYDTLPFKSINYIFLQSFRYFLLPNFSTYIIQLFKYKQFLILIIFHSYKPNFVPGLFFFKFFSYFLTLFNEQRYIRHKKLNKSNYITFDSTYSHRLVIFFISEKYTKQLYKIYKTRSIKNLLKLIERN